MKQMKILGLCLIAAFALSAFAASAASAGTPEVGRCKATVDGKFKDGNCKEKPGAVESEEAFEFVKGAEKVNFKSIGERCRGIHRLRIPCPVTPVPEQQSRRIGDHRYEPDERATRLHLR